MELEKCSIPPSLSMVRSRKMLLSQNVSLGIRNRDEEGT